MTRLCLGTLLVAVWLVPIGAESGAAARSGKAPVFDIKTTCGGTREVSRQLKTSDEYRSCLAAETKARRHLNRRWSSYTARQKRQCFGPGPDPSYVEALTCLQIDRGNGRGPSVGGPIAPGLNGE